MLLKGLTAATYTPMTETGELNLKVIPSYVDYLLASGMNAMYVCGTTGEGVSLSVSERQAVVEAFLAASDGRLPVVVQVGANSLAECCELASHAWKTGASAISATAPSYFKVGTEKMLVDFMAPLAAAAGELPFYYYHIPAFTGAALDMIRFLQLAEERIPNLAGIKFTDTRAFEYQECLEWKAGKYEILWGCDEMLLSALVLGAQGGIGSTYALIPHVYRQLWEAWSGGDLANARKYQAESWQYVRWCNSFGAFHAVQKYLCTLLGFEMGPPRLPLPGLTEEQKKQIEEEFSRFLKR
ncbi:MAG: dihydrodipicolinate synthase family protein [Planctomycetia bacterium]|nr:dihydrodipicolinate synthase family protein [Planctomycetia bacterium]